jgi:hypothetical protein
MIHYFIVSLIEYYSEDIICSDLSHIPSLISSITLKDTYMVDKIFTNAKRLRAITPYSFKLFFDKMGIFNPFGKNHKENYEKYKPESLLCLPILPSEIFYITYNNLVKCPDSRCENFINKKELEEYKEISYDESEYFINENNQKNMMNGKEVYNIENDYCKTFANRNYTKNDNDKEEVIETDNFPLNTEGIIFF